MTLHILYVLRVDTELTKHIDRKGEVLFSLNIREIPDDDTHAIGTYVMLRGIL